MGKTPCTPEPPSSEALFRYQLVSQVLTREAMGKKRAEAIKEVASQTHWLAQGKSRQVSRRTLYRWMASFNKTRFSGLTPGNRQKITGSQVLPKTLLDFFEKQKGLDAKTSIPDLILRAEEYHLIDAADSIDRTTVWRALKRDGVSTHRGKSSKQDQDRRRFAYPHRMDMILCDGKHFRAGAKRLKRVALFYLDDSTRMGLGVLVGTSETSELFLRGFYAVLLRYGLMRSVFLDNGSGFTADDCVAVAGQLNISFIYGTAGYPEGHGKIERFNQTVLNHVLRTLDGNPEINADCDALQLRLQHYLFERYNHTPHEGIDHQTPYDRFHRDTTSLTFKENQAQLRQAFVIHLLRRVSKDHIVSFNSIAYETPRGYAGAKMILYWHILDKKLSMIHQGSLIQLHPVDLNANAVSRRGLPLDTETTRSPLPKTSAEIEFDRQTQPIVDTDGGFTSSDKE